jgi:hypothetical protein
MNIDLFSPSELPLVMRVLRSALRADGPLDEPERRFLRTYARIAGAGPLAADPAPLPVPDLAALHIDGDQRRKRLLQLAAMAVLFSRPLRPASIAFLRHLAYNLGAHDGVLDVIAALYRGQRVRVRLLVMRRGMGVMLRTAYGHGGVAGVLRFFGAMLLRLRVNEDALPRYRRLGLLPDGTLGREYWKHMTEHGFGLPGEKAGVPVTVAFHDVAHVLAGHDTTPLGEIQQGCFQGGNGRHDGFAFVQFVILHFHHGVKITPAAPPETGQFDPEKVLWAIHRGARCRVDMTDRWNYWPLMALPLQQARERLGLLPPLTAQGAAA